MIGSTLLGRYELLQELEDGPLFISYRAQDRSASRPVRVRVVKPAFALETGFIHKLREVCERLKRLTHPSLERVYECSEDAGVWFVASEFISGPSLEDRLKRLTSVSPALALSLGTSICGALEAAHSMGFVHGDVSARNVFASPSGEVKLALVAFWEAYAHSQKVALAVLPAMAPYLAPEITAGGMPSAQSDIYALGALLFQCLSGRYPYQGDTPSSLAVKHAEAPVPSLRAQIASVSPVLDALVKRCLAKSPSSRYASAKVLQRDLNAIQDALRFGRSLSWPLDEGPPAEAPQPVAPRMGALRDPRRAPARAEREDRPESDGVPKWLLALVYISAAAALVTIVSWVLFNLRQPRLVKMPNIVGMTMSEAAPIVEQMNLKLRETQRKPDEEKAEGTILATSPPAGRDVREDAFIDAVVSAGSRNVVMPDVMGKTLDEARSVLTTLQLSIAEPIGTAPSEAPAGTIIKQVPEPGGKAQRQSRVRLTLSGGPTPETPPADTTPPPVDEVRHTYRLKFPVETDLGSVQVRVELTDDEGTRVVYDQSRRNGQTVSIREAGLGDTVTFEVYFDDELVARKEEKAETPSAEATADKKSATKEGGKTGR